MTGPIGIRLSAEKKTLAGGMYKYVKKPNILTFGGAISNNDEVWVGFIGKELSKKRLLDYEDYYAKKIFCYNWEGELIRMFEFEKSIISFDVDWDNMVLYLLADPNNPKIYSHNLKQLSSANK